MNSIKTIIIAAFLLFSIEITHAGGSGAAAVDFLNIGVSARSSATGAAFI